jgi:hypothetical protein
VHSGAIRGAEQEILMAEIKTGRRAGRPSEHRMRSAVRLTPATWERVTKLAADNGRTVIEELEWHLERELVDDRLAKLEEAFRVYSDKTDANLAGIQAELSLVKFLMDQLLTDRGQLVHIIKTLSEKVPKADDERRREEQ